MKRFKILIHTRSICLKLHIVFLLGSQSKEPPLPLAQKRSAILQDARRIGMFAQKL
jgi:hypothetical protein